MAKLRYDSVTGKIEYEGTPEELLSIYDGLKQREIAAKSKETPSSHQEIPIRDWLQSKTAEQKELEAKMPTVKEIIEYILSKPKYEHDIVDVSKKFFNGKQIKARQYGKLYRTLRAKLELARQGIEASEGGAFERRRSPYRNLQIYTFKKVNATPLDTTSQKTS